MNRMAIIDYTKQGYTYPCCITLDENRDFVDFQLFEAKEEKRILNSIFIGRVENILENINAAFVRISETQKCFLSLSDIQNPVFTKKLSHKKAICIGDELLVQVIKDAVKTKDPVVSTNLTIHGRMTVLTTKNKTCSVSKKLDSRQREHYKNILSEMVHTENGSAGLDGADLSNSYGMIIRTDASKYTDSELIADIEALQIKFRDIVTKGMHLSPFQVLYEPEESYLSYLKAVHADEIDEIITDQSEYFEKLKAFCPTMGDKLKLYQDEKVKLSTLYNLNSNIKKLLSNRIWLKSGANIIIEQLETLTVIDVNSGKNEKAKTLSNSDFFLAVNLEAATEIARQIRLRNISGMIIVDFINMQFEDSEKKLIKHLQNELQKDNCPCQFIDITKLGLVELTRKKVHKSLKEMLCFSDYDSVM